MHLFKKNSTDAATKVADDITKENTHKHENVDADVATKVRSPEDQIENLHMQKPKINRGEFIDQSQKKIEGATTEEKETPSEIHGEVIHDSQPVTVTHSESKWSTTSSEEKTTEKSYTVSANKCEENSRFNDIEITMIFTKIFKYGCITFSQVQRVYSEELALKLQREDSLEMIRFQGEEVYLLTEQSLQIFARLTGSAYRDLKKEAQFQEMIDVEDLPIKIKNAEILLAIDMNCEKSKIIFFDFFTSTKPRKKSLKILRCDGKRGALNPYLLIVLQKGKQKFGFLFDELPPYTGFTPGEKTAKYRDTLRAYHSFFSCREKKAEWLQKKKINLSPYNLGMALVLPSANVNLVKELYEECRSQGVDSPIFIIDYDTLLKHFLSGWYSNYNNKMLLKTKKMSGKK